MAAHPTVTAVLQGGSVNQVLANGLLLSQPQPSLDNCGGLTNIQPNETVETVAMPNEYGVTNVSDRVVINYPIMGGPNVSNVNYFNQNSNFLSAPNTNLNSTIVNANSLFEFITNSSHLNQMTGSIHDNQGTKIMEGTRNVHQGCSSNNVKNLVQVRGVATVPPLTLIKLDGDKKEKIGNLKIHMCESFLPGSIVSYNGILDLNFMRNLFEITNVDISFVNNTPFKPGICDALKQIIHNNVLQDWLILKCEEKQMQFFKVNDQLQIYCVNSFLALYVTIAEETSLPLPFITQDSENNTKYYYINFEKGTNNRVKKVNSLIFYDVEAGKKKVPCKYPGIRLDCIFGTSVAGFTIHVHESTMPVYKNVASYIRQLIIYSHIVWGFLQAWIMNVRAHYHNFFSAGDISKKLVLNQTSEMNALTGNEDGLMYFIGYSNFYLQFEPTVVKETMTTFSIENFETCLTCNLSIIQYYRQFMLINDLHYSDALKNIILFSKKNEKNGGGARENIYLPRRTNASCKVDCFQPTLSSQEPQISQQKVVPHSFANAESVPFNEEGRTGGVALQVQPRPGSASNSTWTGNVGDVGNVGNGPQQQPATTDSGRPGLTRPLIKTRTVNEINSLLETPDSVNFHRVSFHNEKVSDPRAQEGKEISAPGLATMIEQILKRCYAANSLSVDNQDRFKDPVDIQRLFDAAVNKAVGRITLESFIEKIYTELLISFSNQTSQKILNALIGRAIGIKYPALRGKYLHAFENFRRGAGGGNKTQAGTRGVPATVSEHQEKVKQVFLLLPKDSPIAKPNFASSNLLINRNAVLVQPTKSVPSNLATVAPIVSGQSIGQRYSCRAEIGPSNVSGEPSLAQENLPVGVNVPYGQCPLEPYESRNESVQGQDKANPPSSSRQMNTNRKRVPAGSETIKKKWTFSIVNNDRENKAIPNVPPQVSVSPSTFRRSEEPKVATVNPSVVQNQNSNGSTQNVPVPFSVNSQCRDNTDELISAPVPIISPLCQSKTPVDSEEVTNDGSPTADSCQENRDSLRVCSRSDDTVKDLPPVTEENIFDRYKLKPCSVVLNADDVRNYYKMREKENEAEEVDEMDSSSDVSSNRSSNSSRFSRKNSRKKDSLSEDPDFYDSVSRRAMKRRRVSEIEYMEARTRVLQRLRKRPAMYLDREKNTKMTSHELDNFIVRRSSIVGWSPYVEDSTDGEDSSEQDGEDSAEQEDKTEEVKERDNKKVTKSLRVVLVRLEDTPEYEKYKCSFEAVGKKSKMIRMGDKTETYYEHILDKKKEYFELIDGKLYLKDKYCVQDGAIVPADARSENSDPAAFKKEPESTENEEDFAAALIKEENSLD